MPAPTLSAPELKQLNGRVELAMDHFRECLWTLIDLFGDQTALSRATGIGLSTLRKYFYPEPPADPSLGNVLRLLFTTGVSPAWMCGGDDGDVRELPVLDPERAAPRELRFTGQRYPVWEPLLGRYRRRPEELFVALCPNLETRAARPVKRPAVVRRLGPSRAALPDGLYLLRSPDGDVLRRRPAGGRRRGAAEVLGRCVWTWTGAAP